MQRVSKGHPAQHSCRAERGFAAFLALTLLATGLAGCEDEVSSDEDPSESADSGVCEGGTCQGDASESGRGGGLAPGSGQGGTGGTLRQPDSEVDSGHDVVGDAGKDAGEDAGPEDASKDGSKDASEGGGPPGCDSDKDCDDGLFCNGAEVCVFADDDEERLSGECAPSPTGSPCLHPELCHEPAARCNCDLDEDGLIAKACGGTDCDDDGDGHNDEVLCGGDDCDDENKHCHPNAIEICDEDGVDEDCDPTTYFNPESHFPRTADADADGFVSYNCYNTDPDTGEVHCGSDCDDTRWEVNPDGDEDCDGIDNDCNGLVDESPGADTHGGLRKVFYPDRDGDMWAIATDPYVSCSRPDGYIERGANQAPDCDDDEPMRHPYRLEICDGLDNDCDGKTDGEDDDVIPLPDQPTFTNTELACIDGEWEITNCPADRLHCTKSVLQGCETPGNTLSNCRACGRTCLFACGQEACDEVEKLSIGMHHACAVTTEGRAACWGRGADGRLGNDSDAASSIPVPVTGLSSGVSQIAAGFAHTCAIAGPELALYCWGANADGQLGNASTRASSVPVAVYDLIERSLTGVTSVSTGYAHTCAVYDGGRVVCWGQQAGGRLGNWETDAGIIPHPITAYSGVTYEDIDYAKQIAVGQEHSCILTTDDTVECWGDNSAGQLGDDSTMFPQAPYSQPVPGLSDVSDVAAGRLHTCVVSSGEVYCWGDNSQLQLGRTSSEDDDIPLPVAGLSNVQAVVAGTYFTCVLTDTDEALCWGSNEDGERGDDDEDARAEPTTLPLANVTTLAARGGACAVTSASEAFCWGGNIYGQLGNNTTDLGPQPVPQRVHSLSTSRP